MLRHVLIALGEPLADLLAAPAGLDVGVDDVVILDPDDEPGDYSRGLVLIVGARGRGALRLVRTAARRGASVAVVKVEPGEDLAALREAAADTGIAILTVRPEVRWDQLGALARGAVADARITGIADEGESGDLFSLAQTVAALTGGIVSIEDTANRVLSYSRSEIGRAHV